jgi:dTDP-4-dehydrorhamnose 3,5-epimerase
VQRAADSSFQSRTYDSSSVRTMKFTELELRGAFVVDIEPHRDDRGFFARTWSEAEFLEHGLTAAISQCSVSYNERKGTLRGMHFQAAPDAEVKVVRCLAGAIWDVIVDLRPSSPTFKKWSATELSALNHRALYVPAGFAHGFQTLCDGSEVFYQISAPFKPEAGRGLRWNDPAIGIEWPNPHTPIMSERDHSYPDFSLRNGSAPTHQRTSQQ